MADDTENTPELAESEVLDNFDRAFSVLRTRSYRCDCGTLYWDSHNSNDWEPGEREELEANEKAVAVEYALDIVCFGEAEYVNACGCWHAKASRVIAWLEDHRHNVVRFYKLEKERLLAAAHRLETVEE